MTVEERIVWLEEQLKHALEQVQALQEHLNASRELLRDWWGVSMFMSCIGLAKKRKEPGEVATSSSP
jgi:hypothetical protein